MSTNNSVAWITPPGTSKTTPHTPCPPKRGRENKRKPTQSSTVKKQLRPLCLTTHIVLGFNGRVKRGVTTILGSLQDLNTLRMEAGTQNGCGEDGEGDVIICQKESQLPSIVKVYSKCWSQSQARCLDVAFCKYRRLSVTGTHVMWYCINVSRHSVNWHPCRINVVLFLVSFLFCFFAD